MSTSRIVVSDRSANATRSSAQCAAALTYAAIAGLLMCPLYTHANYLGKPAIQWQADLTKGADIPTRRSAAFALGKLGLQAVEAVPALLRCAQSTGEDPTVRETAIYSIGQILPRGSADAGFIQLLCGFVAESNHEGIRRSAVVALGHCARDSEETRAVLHAALSDPSPSVRQNAAWAFGEICGKTDDVPVDSLRKTLVDPDKLVKRDGALALGEIIRHRTAMSNDDEHAEQQRLTKVRDTARHALPDLVRCVEDGYLELRKAACGTLIHLVKPEDADAARVLARACTDADLEVRRNGALALAAIGGKSAEPAVKVLQETLQNPDPAVRQLAALAFRTVGAPGVGALPDLLKALTGDPDESVRQYIAVALGGMDSTKHVVVPALANCVANAKEAADVRVAAAVSLQHIGLCEEAVQAIPLLVDVLDDPKQPARVRERTLWALRVHQSNLQSYPALFSALTKILTEPGLRSSEQGAKMLRFDAAFLLGVFQKDKVAHEVFPVLLDFLRDDKIRVFTGLSIQQGGTGEAAPTKVGVGEQGTQDGRINAVRALEAIGPDRSHPQLEIIQQLCELRDTTTIIDQGLRDAATKLLKDWGVK